MGFGTNTEIETMRYLAADAFAHGQFNKCDYYHNEASRIIEEQDKSKNLRDELGAFVGWDNEPGE